MRSQTTFDLQYAHRFYGFKGEAQYLHGHTGTLTIEITDSDSADGIVYQLDPGEEVSFRLSDFRNAYQEEYSGTPRWVEFETDDTLSKSRGAVYFDYDGDDEKMFSASAAP